MNPESDSVHESQDASTAGNERVRPCLDCGTILPFDAEICSLCGERYRVGRIDDEAVKPCLACDSIIPARHLFCPSCGDFMLDVEVGGDFVPPIGKREGEALQGAVRVLSVSSLVAVLLLACAAAFDAARELAKLA